MTSAEYWKRREREQADEWLDEVGIGRPSKGKYGLTDYALIISVFVGMAWFWWQAIENLSK